MSLDTEKIKNFVKEHKIGVVMGIVLVLIIISLLIAVIGLSIDLSSSSSTSVVVPSTNTIKSKLMHKSYKANVKVSGPSAFVPLNIFAIPSGNTTQNITAVTLDEINDDSNSTSFGRAIIGGQNIQAILGFTGGQLATFSEFNSWISGIDATTLVTSYTESMSTSTTTPNSFLLKDGVAYWDITTSKWVLYKQISSDLAPTLTNATIAGSLTWLLLKLPRNSQVFGNLVSTGFIASTQLDTYTSPTTSVSTVYATALTPFNVGPVGPLLGSSAN